MNIFRFFCVLIAGATLAPAADEARLIIVDPGHFHAALIQKDSYPFLSRHVSVYASLSPELLDYLNRISLFNARAENPTNWELDVHTGPDFFNRMLREHAGNIVVLTGRNRGKIDRIRASLDAGYHVFADKPWIISSADLPKLAGALDFASAKGLAAYDIMTERFEVTSRLQREFVNTPEVFGTLVTGSAVRPAVKARSVHHLMKMVAGVPIKRPAWFFDIDEYGEALADVGTHVVDLVEWTVFPSRRLDYRSDVRIVDAKHWPTAVTAAQFKQVTGEDKFPAALSRRVRNGQLDYLSNNSVRYTVAGVYVGLEILWNWEAPQGLGDVYEASFQGTKSRVELRQGQVEKGIPEVYVVPDSAADAAGVFEAVRSKVEALQAEYPGLAMRVQGAEARLIIPSALRVGHEAHFAQVAKRFFEYTKAPGTMPEWEKSNMMVKYFITTKGVEAAR